MSIERNKVFGEFKTNAASYSETLEVKMKIGITNSVYRISDDSGTDYKKMKTHGYDCADFQDLIDTNESLYCVGEGIFERLLTDEKQRAADEGIVFSQVHGPWPVTDTTESGRIKALDNMKRAIKGTALLGSDYLVIHPCMPFGWDNDDDPDFTLTQNRIRFRELCEYAGAYNVGICIENMPFKAYQLSRTSALVDFVDELNYPNLFICLDTGHSNLLGDDNSESIRLCGSRLKVLHIHDNRGFFDTHSFPYWGTINWDEVKTALREIGFDGCFSAEVKLGNENMPEDIKEYMLVTLSKIMRSLTM